ncbi:MAG: hypothetical protein ACRDQV_12885 [Pseudonocardiaceae bacterium]
MGHAALRETIAILSDSSAVEDIRQAEQDVLAEHHGGDRGLAVGRRPRGGDQLLHLVRPGIGDFARRLDRPGWLDPGVNTGTGGC